MLLRDIRTAQKRSDSIWATRKHYWSFFVKQKWAAAMVGLKASSVSAVLTRL